MKRFIENDLWKDTSEIESETRVFIQRLMDKYPDHSLYDLRTVVEDIITMSVVAESAKRQLNKRIENGT